MGHGASGGTAAARAALVVLVVELALQAQVVREVAEQVFKEKKTRVPYLVGTMIELPRAALTAGELPDAPVRY